MPRSNLSRFYQREYEKALINYTNGDKVVADDQCRELVSDFQCPRLYQIQAWQLRSLCTDDYWLAKAHLSSGLRLIASIENQANPLLERLKSHTAAMLDELETVWKAHWEEQGKSPPTEPWADEGDKVDREQGDTDTDTGYAESRSSEAKTIIDEDVRRQRSASEQTSLHPGGGADARPPAGPEAMFSKPLPIRPHPRKP